MGNLYSFQNCLQKDTGIKQTLLQGLFGHLSKFGICWGYSILSYFDAQRSGMIADMDAALPTYQIFLYKVEWAAVDQYYRDAGMMPNNSTLSDENLLKLTGRASPRIADDG